jgi:hypothetical protein
MRFTMRTAVAGLALTCAVLTGAPVRAQGGEFAKLLSGREVPLSMKLKDLTPEWRRLKVASDVPAKGGLEGLMGQLAPLAAMMGSGKGPGKGNEGGGGIPDAAAGLLGMSMLGGLFGGSPAGGADGQIVLFTRGQTITLGGETFLLGYQLQKGGKSLGDLALESAKNGGKEPDFKKAADEGRPGADTVLTLSMLNLRGVKAFTEIRPFNLEQELAEASRVGGGGLLDLLGAFADAKPGSNTGGELKADPPKSAAPAPRPAPKPAPKK